MRPKALVLEGGILSPDFLEGLLQDPKAWRPEAFGLPPGSLDESLAGLYERARSLYERFLKQQDYARLSSEFLGLLGYHPHPVPEVQLGKVTYRLGHRLDGEEGAPPLLLLPLDTDFDQRYPGYGRSPHGYLQDYLNASEDLYGLLYNGQRLRLLRDNPLLTRPAYVEANLDLLLTEDLFLEFKLFYALFHRSRFSGPDPSDWPIEAFHRASLEEGSRARGRFREAVESFLKDLGTAVLGSPGGEAYRQDPERLYRDLLRLSYRLLFLLVAEARGLLGNDLYRKVYAVETLREAVDDPEEYTEDADLWYRLKALFTLLREEGPALTRLGLPALNGHLFEPLPLEAVRVCNRDLLAALGHLFYLKDEKGYRQRIGYGAINVEELGSVYESLLDHRPVITSQGEFGFAPGAERKQTGSYYTPESLVKLVLDEALLPVVETRVKEAGEDPEAKEKAILSLKVLDPAMGSGHFLLGAARALGLELARVRTGSPDPSPREVRRAVRDVIGHCLYGVDKNPMAVELARVALWIEGHVEDKPLTFLDHRIRVGDSLLGLHSPEPLLEGIPDGAYEPKTGDDKKTARALKRKNHDAKEARRWGMQSLLGERTLLEEGLGRLAGQVLESLSGPEEDLAKVRAKAEAYGCLKEDRLYQRLKQAADLYVGAFLQPLTPGGPKVTSEELFGVLDGGVYSQAGEIGNLLERHRPFHWWLEFPEVFAQGGFDVVVGNPPWEQVELREEEFFAGHDPEIARAEGARRKKLIEELKETNPDLWGAYQQAQRDYTHTRAFLRNSGLYPLTGQGRVNTYAVFAERARSLLKKGGRMGLIVPTGIATDNTTKDFFVEVVEKGELVAFYDFQNRKRLFPAVVTLQRFAVFVLQRGAGIPHLRLAFFCYTPDEVPSKTLTLTPEAIARVNPNTRTLPTFRTRQDAELTLFIYERVPVLVNERTGENPWGVRFKRGLFRTREELEKEGFQLVGNRFVKDSEVYLPLYEAKMIWLYDHRYGTYEGVEGRSSTKLPKLGDAQHADPAFLAQPRYWVPAKEVEARLEDWGRGWLLGFRRIARSTDERTAIFSFLPRVEAGDVLPIMLGLSALGAVLLAGATSAIAFDFVVRQKIGGVHLDFHYAKQLPVLPPYTYTPEHLLFIVPRVLELVYTAWDIKPFADDVWQEADGALRDAIRGQWEENKAHAGGHPWAPPPWVTAYPGIETDPQKGIPLSPFKWDEARRARLRAELDAYYAHLYGLGRKQLRYILDPADLTERELKDLLSPEEEVENPLDKEGYQKRVASKGEDFPHETFRVLKEKELRAYGEYRTRRLVLEAWNRLFPGKTPTREAREEEKR